MQISRKRKRQLAAMDLQELRQVLIGDIRKIPMARVKRKLQAYHYCKMRIDGNLDHIQQLRSTMQKVTVTFHDAPGGGGQGKDAADLIGKIMKLEEQVRADTERLRYELAEVQFLIDSLEDFRERSILQLRYVNGCSWDEISDRVYIAKRWVYRLHGRALKKLLGLVTKLATKSHSVL